ncbi:MAG: hypothetical protein ACM3U2_12165 [Deltaproteobacteria bacterium]
MSDSPATRNPFFPLAAFFSALFIITILALLASVFGNEQAPLARLLNQYAGRLIAGEVAAILLTGFLALFVDRRQTLRSRDDPVANPVNTGVGSKQDMPPLRKEGPGGVA